MPDIHIVTFSGEHAKQIIAALKFYSNASKSNLHLHCPSLTIEQNIPEYLSLKTYAKPEDLVDAVKGKSENRLYAGLGDFTTFCEIEGTYANTLALHPEASLVLQHPDDVIPRDKLCFLASESNLTDKLEAKVYTGITEYRTKHGRDELLVTRNVDLLHALLNVDIVNWIVCHPAHNALNLALELWDDPINHIQDTLNIFVELQLHKLSGTAYAKWIQELNTLRTNNTHSYSFFAKHYDEYMSHVVYDKWVQRILGWYSLYSKLKLERILEHACGTANVSNRLVFQGYHVDACDLSSEMLFEADKKPLKPNLYRASLTDPIPAVDYDLILCMFDSVNYLCKSSEISKMLEEVHKSLKDDGLFIFDISTVFNSEENFADICNLNQHKEGYLVHKAWFDPDKARQYSALTSFKKGFIGYSYQYEIHKQRVYLCQELITLIEKSPLKLKAIHSSESKINFFPRHTYGLDDKYSRLFFVLRREPSVR